MKDLKHYFTENCETSNKSDTIEVTKEPGNAIAIAQNPKEPTPPTTKKKRGRVKIKISQTNVQGRICDIVESKSDLVDKTPSPFTPRELNTNESSDTPKRSTSLSRKSTKKKPNEDEKTCAKSKDKETNPGDENDNLMSNMKTTVGVDNKVVAMKTTVSPGVPSEEKGASNAFQILMTRKKTVQYILPVQQSVEEQELAAKILLESKTKLKQNKDKLIVLADKKGYSKRKLGEMEEAEKIEKRLEKRAKVFKQNKTHGDDASSPVSRRRTGGLHDYFSKAEPKAKELTNTSTFVVKAEVYSLDSENMIKHNKEEKAVLGVMNTTNEKLFATANDIQVLDTENIELPVECEENRPNQRRIKKPKWTLRINLQCNGEAEGDSNDTSDDTNQRGKRKSLRRKNKITSPSHDEDRISESEPAIVKSTKKRKSELSGEKKIEKSSINADVRLTDTEVKVVYVAPKNSEKTRKSEEIDVVFVKEGKPQSGEKLAPLFVKRPKLDPAVLEARRLFLKSVPTENSSPRAERHSPVVGIPLLPFPTISHVAQLDVSTNIDIIDLKMKYPLQLTSTFTPSLHLNQLKSLISLDNLSPIKSNDVVESPKDNVDDVLAEIEERCADAREIWKKISLLTCERETEKLPKRKGKKRKTTEKKVDKGVETKESHDDTWTHKYRPMNCSEIVGNEDAAKKLYKWLEGWKVPVQNDDSSSGDEFYSSDYSYAENNQVAVLLGPHGSGKTASVYAIAAQLDYSVIEVNASSKRTGKRILKDLEEATRSHRIKRPDLMSFAPIINEIKSMPKKSLILVEDLDLIFEEDDGFISATCQLASKTKRPIVMTARDTCSHLSRMAPQQLRIYYQRSIGSRVSAMLELITLGESGCRLPRPCLNKLLQTGDLRKALLQLQYLLLSGKPNVAAIPTNFHQSLWQDMRHCLYKPAIKATKKSSKKLANVEQANPRTQKAMNELANDLDTMSLVTTLIEIDDPALVVSSLKFEASLSLNENMNTYSSINNTSLEIAEWLSDKIMNGKQSIDTDTNASQNLRQLTLRKELNTGVNMALSKIPQQTLDGRVITVDYLPSLRTICRAEENRVTSNNKRGNRFFHYLQNLRGPSTSTKPNILSAACKMLREKNSES